MSYDNVAYNNSRIAGQQGSKIYNTSSYRIEPIYKYKPYDIDDRLIWREYNYGIYKNLYPRCANSYKVEGEFPREIIQEQKYEPPVIEPEPEPEKEPVKPQHSLEEMNMAAEKIQKNYRGHASRLNTARNKTKWTKESKDMVDDLKRSFERNGKTDPDSTFNLEGWKEFYPEDGYYYNYNGGEHAPQGIIFHDSVRVGKNYDGSTCVYEGDMDLNGERHGFGKVSDADGVKMGTWRNGELTGWCRDSKRNGNSYEGKFDNGSLTGKGILRNKRNHLYKGDFKDYIRDGEGVLITENTKYQGEYRNDKKNGQGSLVFTNMKHKYEGEFTDDQITGKGKFTWKNGDVYVGEMLNGKMHGEGKYYYKSTGQVYEGSYQDGKKHGQGKIIFPDKKELEAVFERGKADGRATFIKDGVEKQLEFEEGKVSRIVGLSEGAVVRSQVFMGDDGVNVQKVTIENPNPIVEATPNQEMDQEQGADENQQDGQVNDGGDGMVPE